MRFAELLRAPLDDYTVALERCASDGDRHFIWIAPLCAALCWWIYVPIHELLHAFGCIATGGTVTRLEIDAIYGAAWLRRFFPFVAVGSDYAGQLTGFDTHGNDLIYMATDALPFALTVLIGVPLLRSAATSGRRLAAVKMGAAIPVAFAPFLSLTGDYYEMGSILGSRLAQVFQPTVDISRWRSDDLIKLTGELFGGELWTGLDVAVVGGSALLGALLCWLTYALGIAVDRLYRRSQAAPAS
jgi:hypothetical protein